MAGRRILGVAVLVGVLLVGSACGDDDGDGGTEPEAINPLTGQTGGTDGPVTIVKIDNTPDGRPPSGLNDADVVYLQQVEGGQTRLAAVFATHRPTDVYAVRSARETDVELFAPYGGPILVFSGANSGVMATVDDSPLVAVSEDRDPDSFGSVPGRVRPYQTSVDVAAVAEANPEGSSARDVGFDWAEAAPAEEDDEDSGRRGEATPEPDVWAAAPATTSWSVSMGDVTSGFSWDAASSSWVWAMNGRQIADASGAPVTTPNVIVQYCVIRQSQYVDTTGAPTPFTETVGTGAAVVFREGKRLDGQWSRARSGDATVFRTDDGREIPLTPGGTWVLLAPQGNPVVVP